MRRRVKRDLSILFGVVGLIVAAVVINYAFNRGTLAREMDALRRQVEAQREGMGLELLKWQLLRTTEGSARSGPTFTPETLAKDGQQVDIVGFMVPLEQFRNVTEFLLLPLPIECYFCEIPPMRDVMMVQMKEGETTQIYDNPVLLNGVLHLNQGEDVKFFYELHQAELGPGKPGEKLQIRQLDPEHMIPQHEAPENLVEGMEPPAAQ